MPATFHLVLSTSSNLRVLIYSWAKISGAQAIPFMEAVCAPFFCSASEHAFTLHSSPFLRPPVFIGIPRGEEFTAPLHPLFTTLHRFQRPTGANCSARPLGVKERCKTARRPWGGCAISLDNSLAHNSWASHAHHLLCMRISAVIQAHNNCCAAEDTDCLNNIS